MIYGLYLSAAGIISNAYRQDVIANNLANAETIGFKRDLALFRQRATAARERNEPPGASNRLLEALGGGLLAEPTLVDSRQGELEHTGNSLDVAIEGDGYFAVSANGQTHLTRNGQFMVDRDGNLVLSNMQGQKVLDRQGQPLHLQQGGSISVDVHGLVTQDQRPVGQLGFFNADPSRLTKQGGTLIDGPPLNELQPGGGQLRAGFMERANVDPTTELAELMDTQRQLEANANMLRYQDTTLEQLVSSVGKIS